MDRASQVQEMRSRQEKWFRERQVDMDRSKVVSELRAESMGAGASSSSPPVGHYHAASYSDHPSSSMQQQQQQQHSYSYTQQQSYPQQQQSYSQQQGSPQGSVRQSSQQQQQQQLGWSGNIRPEAVIDKLTERIADRLRSELKMELKKESETLQQRVVHENLEMDDFLAKELETQNTCPICYDLMVPPNHAPQLLFPCGHTFCSACINMHLDQQKKTHCPICRKKVESRAPNYSLQQLILNFVNKKNRMQSPLVASVAQSMEANRGVFNSNFDDESLSELDRLRRQSGRIQIRLTVLENELADTISEHKSLEGRSTSARMVLEHMKAEEQMAEQKMAALQAELNLLRSQMSLQQEKFDQASTEAAEVLSRRQMLVNTIEPLQAELRKVEILKQGYSEQNAR